MKTSFLNVAEFMTYQAQVQGDKVALLAKKKSWLNFFGIRNSKYETLTYNEIEKRINHYAHTFIDNGLKAGDKILVFIKPSLDFPIIIFSLFRAGVIPVFIDPGMGIESLLKCIEASHAKAIIGIPKIHHLRLLKGSHFSQIEHAFVVGGRAVNAISFDLLLKKIVMFKYMKRLLVLKI